MDVLRGGLLKLAVDKAHAVANGVASDVTGPHAAPCRLDPTWIASWCGRLLALGHAQNDLACERDAAQR